MPSSYSGSKEKDHTFKLAKLFRKREKARLDFYCFLIFKYQEKIRDSYLCSHIVYRTWNWVEQINRPEDRLPVVVSCKMKNSFVFCFSTTTSRNSIAQNTFYNCQKNWKLRALNVKVSKWSTWGTWLTGICFFSFPPNNVLLDCDSCRSQLKIRRVWSLTSVCLNGWRISGS